MLNRTQQTDRMAGRRQSRGSEMPTMLLLAGAFVFGYLLGSRSARSSNMRGQMGERAEEMKERAGEAMEGAEEAIDTTIEFEDEEESQSADDESDSDDE